MVNLDIAKMHVKNALDSAFNKTTGTKKGRADMANICCSICPTSRDDSVALLLWAVDYATNWKLQA